MSRSRPVEGPTISLFPFLAVLLCTMGALLVVLVLFSHSAKTTAEAAVAAVDPELELAKENAAWRLGQLEGVRTRTIQDLSKARLQLAGTEEHNRELADELARLEKTLADLDSGKSEKTTADELRDLEARLKSSRESLDKARAELASRPPPMPSCPTSASTEPTDVRSTSSAVSMVCFSSRKGSGSIQPISMVRPGRAIRWPAPCGRPGSTSPERPAARAIRWLSPIRFCSSGRRG